MTIPLHCKVCAKLLRGQQRLYCGRPCKRRAYLVQRKLRDVGRRGVRDLAHTLYHIFDGWRTRK